MKESYVQLVKFIKGFYHDIIKRTFLMFLLGCVIVFVIQAWRFNILAYILCFMICFGINFFYCFIKREIRKEFYESS